MNPALEHISATLISLREAVKKDIIGQDVLIDKLLITVFSGGHALLEGVPGLGKTKTIRTLARVLGLPSKRISFTPDLLPSDLTGAEIYRPGKGEFAIRKGPIFTNILLADEINRTPPKVQSALLEAMEEKRVTIAEETLALPSPFIVFATQNPIEHEGTYPLPEAQLDRFLMRIILDYPEKSAEKSIIMASATESMIPENTEKEDKKKGEKKAVAAEATAPANATPAAPSREDIIEMSQYIARNVRVDEKIYDYVLELISAYRSLTHTDRATFAPLSYGPSTRAGIALIKTARVLAILYKRDYVLPEDIKYLAHDVFDHRIALSYEAMSDGMTIRDITDKVLDNVKIV